MTYQKITKAVLPVAGFGTRVLPATKSIPKELLPVVDRPALQYVVDEARDAGIEHFIFVTGRGKGAIEDYFDRAYELEDALERKGKTEILGTLKKAQLGEGQSSFVRQQVPKGLGHAVWCARDITGDEPFAVLLPDVLIQSKTSCLAQMMDAYQTHGGNIIAVDPIPEDEVNKYGVIAPAQGEDHKTQKLIRMDGMVEKPPIGQAPSNMKITGRYILQPELMGLLKDQAAGAGGEIQLTDAMARLMETQDFRAFVYDGQDYDCGSRIGYFKAVLGFGLTHPDIGEQARAILQDMAQ